MMKPEEEFNIGHQNELPTPPIKPALPTPHVPEPSENALASAIANKENVTAELVPFEANFNDDGLSDMDLLSALCGLKNQTVSVTNTNTIIFNSMSHAPFTNLLPDRYPEHLYQQK